MPEITPDFEDYDTMPSMTEAIDMHIEGIDELAAVRVRTEELAAERDALLTAINEAVHIFDRDGGESQSAWNMRAVLLQALDKLESKTS